MTGRSQRLAPDTIRDSLRQCVCGRVVFSVEVGCGLEPHLEWSERLGRCLPSWCRRRVSGPPDRRKVPIGELLRSERIAQGLSLREAAARIGVSFATISRIERSVNPPDVKTLRLIAEWTGVDAEDLL